MQVTKHVHAIKIPFQITNNLGITVDRFVYAYLIYGKKICLIDSGVACNKKRNRLYHYCPSGRKVLDRGRGIAI